MALYWRVEKLPGYMYFHFIIHVSCLAYQLSQLDSGIFYHRSCEDFLYIIYNSLLNIPDILCPLYIVTSTCVIHYKWQYEVFSRVFVHTLYHTYTRFCCDILSLDLTVQNYYNKKNQKENHLFFVFTFLFQIFNFSLIYEITQWLIAAHMHYCQNGQKECNRSLKWYSLFDP